MAQAGQSGISNMAATRFNVMLPFAGTHKTLISYPGIAAAVAAVSAAIATDVNNADASWTQLFLLLDVSERDFPFIMGRYRLPLGKRLPLPGPAVMTTVPRPGGSCDIFEATLSAPPLSAPRGTEPFALVTVLPP